MRCLLAVAVIAAVLGGSRRLDAKANKRAVLRSDASVRIAAKRSSPTIELGGKSATAGYDVEILGTSGDFLRVQPIDGVGCNQSLIDDANIALELFVLPDALHRVLTEPLSLDLSDGRRLDALPGTIVENQALHVGGVSAVLDLPESLTGSRFEPSDLPFSTPADIQVRPRDQTAGDVALDFDDRLIAAHKISSSPLHVAIERHCFRLEIDVPEEFPLRRSASTHLLWHSIEKGTALRWANKKRAGSTRDEVRMTKEPVVIGKSSCFRLTLGTKGQVQVCAPTKKVTAHDLLATGTRALQSRVQVTTVRVGSGLSKANVNRSLRSQSNRFRSCHRLAPRKGMTLRKGQTLIRFSVDASGKAGSIKIRKNTTGSSKLATCISAAIGRSLFRSPNNGKSTKVTIRLQFLAR